MSSKTKRSPVGVLMELLNGAGSLLILLMTVLICADIARRTLFGVPVAGVAEMISLSIVAVVFLQLGQAVRSNSLARTEFAMNFMQRKMPRAEAFLQSVYALIAVLVFAVLAYGVWFKLQDAIGSDEHVGVYGLFVAPVWPVYLIVLIGSVAAALQFSIQMWQHIKRCVARSTQEV